MVSAAAQVREAIVGWGKGLDCRLAREDSKDLAAVRGEGERDRDDSKAWVMPVLWTGLRVRRSPSTDPSACVLGCRSSQGLGSAALLTRRTSYL